MRGSILSRVLPTNQGQSKRYQEINMNFGGLWKSISGSILSQGPFEFIAIGHQGRREWTYNDDI